MNESITCEEVLHLARHLHACMDALLERIAAEQATAKPTRLKKAVTADG